jgi:hypothetical protein
VVKLGCSKYANNPGEPPDARPPACLRAAGTPSGPQKPLGGALRKSFRRGHQKAAPRGFLKGITSPGAGFGRADYYASGGRRPGLARGAEAFGGFVCRMHGLRNPLTGLNARCIYEVALRGMRGQK